MRTARAWLALAVVVLGGGTLVGRAPADEFFFKPKDRIVFLGDSITEQYEYTNLVEYYLLTRFPQWDLTIYNAGIGGDTAGGGLNRAERDILCEKPTAVTINFGMNDGGYRGPDEKIYADYIKNQDGLVKKLIEGKARVALLSTSPVEGRKRKDGEAYNETLGKFADGLKDLAARDNATFVDQFHRELPVLLKMAEDKAAFDCFGDSVHTNTRGGLLMAWGILTGMHAPATVSDLTLDAQGKVVAAERCKVSDVKKSEGKLTFTRLDEALPMVVSADQKPLLPYLKNLGDLNYYGLKVTGLDKDASYVLAIDGKKVGAFSGGDLEKGVNLANEDLGAIAAQSLEVWKAQLEKNQLLRHRYNNYRRGGTPPGLTADDKKEFATLHEKERAIVELALDKLRKQVYEVAQPKPHVFELTGGK